MPATYSINHNSTTESTRKEDIYSVLQSIPNNTQKLIKPRDVRDAFLSAWANSSFKITKSQNSDTEYIGLDSGDPNNRDIKNKILLGKRSFGNTDVMNNQLLTNDTDIFFYNTKESESQSTKIGILAGTNSESHTNAPYLEVSATSSLFDFNIINPSGGDVSLKSTTGNVFLNGIPFPKVGATVSDGDVLRYTGVYPLGKLEWGPANIAVTSTIGTPNLETNIYGDGVNLNGFPLEFINDTLVPVTVGGIEQGSSFPAGSFQGQNWPLSEVIRELLYPYVQPKLDLLVYNQNTNLPYGDVGFNTPLVMSYSVTTFSRETSEDLYDVKITKLPSDVILNIGTFSDMPGTVLSNTINYELSTGEQVANFELSVKNIIDGTVNSYTVSKSLELVRPFAIFVIPEGSNKNIEDQNVVTGEGNASEVLKSVLFEEQQEFKWSKSILPYVDENTIIPIDLSIEIGNSYLYFAYPFDYPKITGIRDNTTGLVSSPSSFVYSEEFTDVSDPYLKYRIYKFSTPVIIEGRASFTLLFNQSNGFFGVNDSWSVTTSGSSYILPNPSGVGGVSSLTLRRFNNNTTSITISAKSFNNNNYSSILNLPIGSIILISQNNTLVKYVVNNLVDITFTLTDLSNPTFKIPVQAIIPGNPIDGLLVQIGSQINFRVI